MLMSTLSLAAPDSGRASSPFHGLYTGAADAVFKVPFFRELCGILCVRSASVRTMNALLEQGKSVSIYPGGIHEQLASDSKQERCFFAPKLGFVRQAMKYGVPLQPIYSFGENQLWDVPEWARKVAASIKKHTGAGVPIAVGRCWFLPFLPNKQHLQVEAGRPIEVGPADANPSDERVQQVFRAYVAELYRLFNEHKDAALPADVAARGLQVIWRGHESVDLSEQSLKRSTCQPTTDGERLAKTSKPRRLPRSTSEPVMSMSRL